MYPVDNPRQCRRNTVTANARWEEKPGTRRFIIRVRIRVRVRGTQVLTRYGQRRRRKKTKRTPRARVQPRKAKRGRATHKAPYGEPRCYRTARNGQQAAPVQPRRLGRQRPGSRSPASQARTYSEFEPISTCLACFPRSAYRSAGRDPKRIGETARAVECKGMRSWWAAGELYMY